jgi:hypothetical protein
MPVPAKYRSVFIPVKHFLSSHSAFDDGRRAIKLLQEQVEQDCLYLSDWKIHWVAACTLLRTAIDLFQKDARICVSQSLGAAMRAEWKSIKDDREAHKIYWDFLREERNNIIHEYSWAAYEYFLDRGGDIVDSRALSLLMPRDDLTRVLRIRRGVYKGADALALIGDASAWVEQRLLSGIERAGLDPNEQRNLVTFRPRPLGEA